MVITMNDISSLNLVFLCKEVEVHLQETLDRRTKGPDHSLSLDPQKEYDGCIFSRKYCDMITLLLICCFLSDRLVGFETYIAIEVEEYNRKICLFPEIGALASVLKNRYSFLYILFNYSRIDTVSKLYTVCLNPETVVRCISKLRLKYIKQRKPRRVQRHKGYRDHGSLRPSESWVETHDWSFTEKQLNLEEKQNVYENTRLQIIRESGDWYLKQLENERSNEYEQLTGIRIEERDPKET